MAATGALVGAPLLAASFERAPREDAGHGLGVTVEDFEDLAGEHDFERPHKRPQLSGSEQVIVGGGAPTELALLHEERLTEEVAAGTYLLEEVRHPASVEVLEHHDDIEWAFRERIGRQITENPLDLYPGLRGRTSGLVQALGIVVNCHNASTALRCRDRLGPVTTCQIEDASPRLDHTCMPLKPGTRHRSRSCS